MPKMPSKKNVDLGAADKLLESKGTDSELSKTRQTPIPRKLAKSQDTQNYKKQQFYCERELLAWVLSLKADPDHGDLSDVINQAIREYKARLEVS